MVAQFSSFETRKLVLVITMTPTTTTVIIMMMISTKIDKLIDFVDKKNKLDVTFCILYFSSNSCSTCFGQPFAHHQVLTTA